MALMNETGYAYTPISCRDEDGLFIRGEKLRYIRINTDRDSTLVYEGYGLIPEPYAHYINGVRRRQAAWCVSGSGAGDALGVG